MADQFTYTLQFAGYAYDRYDEKGSVDYDRFVSVFDQFPWIEELKKRAALDDGCSATISVTDQKTKREYWVSIAGSESDHVFLLGLVSDKEVKTMWGFGKPKRIRWVEIYVAPSRSSVLETFKIFFAGDDGQLREMVRRFDKFGEMEAWKAEKA